MTEDIPILLFLFPASDTLPRAERVSKTKDSNGEIEQAKSGWFSAQLRGWILAYLRILSQLKRLEIQAETLRTYSLS